MLRDVLFEKYNLSFLVYLYLHMSVHFSVIAACTLDGGIGYQQKIPWHLKMELHLFRAITTHTQDSNRVNAVIMGRKTWESLPKKPLSCRFNIVVSKSLIYLRNAIVVRSFQDALGVISHLKQVENTFVIGGSELYDIAVRHESCMSIFLTKIEITVPCDRFFPLQYVHDHFHFVEMISNSENDVPFHTILMKNLNHSDVIVPDKRFQDATTFFASLQNCTTESSHPCMEETT